MTREKTTRRAAIGMIAGGGALLGAETAGFTTVSANRIADLAVADERKDAIVGIKRGLETGETHESPHEVELQNNFDKDDEITVDLTFEEDLALDGDQSDPAFTDGEAIGDGDTATAFIETTASEEVTETVTVVAEGAGATATLEREITIEGIGPSEEDDELIDWFDAQDEETVVKATEEDIDDGDEVDEWQSRPEASSVGSLDEDGDQVRPVWSDTGWQGELPSIDFEDDDVLRGADSVDVSDTEAASLSIVAVVDGGGGERAVSLMNGNGDGQQVSFDVDEGRVRVALADDQGEGSESVKLDLSMGTDPTIAVVVVEGFEYDPDSEDQRDFEARTYTRRATEDYHEFTDRGTALGDFDISLGDDPEGFEDLDIEEGEGYGGEIAELLFYNRVIDDEDGAGDELDEIVTYLEDKWGL